MGGYCYSVNGSFCYYVAPQDQWGQGLYRKCGQETDYHGPTDQVSQHCWFSLVASYIFASWDNFLLQFLQQHIVEFIANIHGVTKISWCICLQHC